MRALAKNIFLFSLSSYHRTSYGTRHIATNGSEIADVASGRHEVASKGGHIS